MDVETDVSNRGRLTHGPVLPVSALLWWPHTSRVTHDGVSDWSNHCFYRILALLSPRADVPPSRFDRRKALLGQFDGFRRRVDNAEVGGMDATTAAPSTS